MVDHATCFECSTVLEYDRSHPRGHPESCPNCGNRDLVYEDEQHVIVLVRCDACLNGWKPKRDDDHDND